MLRFVDSWTTATRLTLVFGLNQWVTEDEKGMKYVCMRPKWINLGFRIYFLCQIYYETLWVYELSIVLTCNKNYLKCFFLCQTCLMYTPQKPFIQQSSWCVWWFKFWPLSTNNQIWLLTWVFQSVPTYICFWCQLGCFIYFKHLHLCIFNAIQINLICEDPNFLYTV